MMSKHNIKGGHASIRAPTPDRLPLAGWINCQSGMFAKEPEYDSHGFFSNTGQGSRGTVIAPMTAEMIISELLGEPSILPACVVKAMSPNRFYKRKIMKLP